MGIILSITLAVMLFILNIFFAEYLSTKHTLRNLKLYKQLNIETIYTTDEIRKLIVKFRWIMAVIILNILLIITGMVLDLYV
jgi:hypothetical protein